MVRGIAREVVRLREAGPTEEELARARTLLQVRWVRRMESFEARATALAWSAAHGDLALLDREYERLLQVTPAEIRDAAARYLVPEHVAGVEYLPHEGPGTLTPGLLVEAFRAPMSRPAANGGADRPRAQPATARVLRADRSTAGTEHYALPGADLLVHRKPGIPTTTLHLHFQRAWEQAERAGLGALAVRSAVRGTDAYDAAGLALAMERLGGTLAPSASTDGLALGTTVLTAHLGEAARLIGSVISSPRFAAADVMAERTVLLEEAREAADDMFRFPFQLAFRSAFGDAGYGIPAGGLESSLGSFTPTDAAAAWRSVTSGRATIVVVGDAEPAALAGTVANALPELVDRSVPAAQRNGATAPWLVTAPAPVVMERRKQQSAFAMLFPGPVRGDDRHTAAEVWSAVASGLGGRLFEALREKRSLAYTVLGTAWARRRAGALGVYIATSPAREEEARAEMLKELAKFTAEPVSAEELERAREYLAGQSEISRMTAGAVAGEIAEVWLQGKGLAELEAPWEKYRQVTAAEVLVVARETFASTRRAEGVVRGSA